jgi:hypothetical protein
MSISYGGDNITFPDASTQNTSPKVGMVNRIINGAMTIDQRNAGASVTINNGTPTLYPVDRFSGSFFAATGEMTLQRSTDIPSGQGYINSVVATVTTANGSLAATDTVRFEQRVEGFNTYDLSFGTAGAKPITLSFWVKSSLTGTFGGNVRNAGDAGTRLYLFSYTINAANTWEYKTITIAGDTSGTWGTGSGIGVIIQWSLGAGADRVGTAGSWGTTFLTGVTGQTQIIGTSGATFYITGVQLEKGSTATPFEFRSIGQEFILCQRYFQKYISPAGNGIFNSTTSIARCAVGTQVQFRATPTVSISGTLGCYDGSATGTITAFSATYAGVNTMEFDATVATGTFTANRIARLYISAETGTINGSAEL